MPDVTLSQLRRKTSGGEYAVRLLPPLSQAAADFYHYLAADARACVRTRSTGADMYALQVRVRVLFAGMHVPRTNAAQRGLHSTGTFAVDLKLAIIDVLTCYIGLV